MATKETKVTKISKPKKVAAPKNTSVSNLSIQMVSCDGKDGGELSLPAELFGQKVNNALIAQAIRVYLNNLKTHFANTKTRSEVQGSTKKIFKQKGTGRARHGSVRAPIFVGGGVAIGPKYHKVTMDLPKKMKRAALISALSDKLASGKVWGLSGTEKLTGKTSELNGLALKLAGKNTLIVTDSKVNNILRAAKNIKNVGIVDAEQLNTLGVVNCRTLIFTKDAVGKLELRMKKEEK